MLGNQKGLAKEPFTKRIFDVSIALIGLILLFPFALVIMVAIWLEDRGPAFYLGERVGKGGRVFKLYKFRSMHMQPQEETRTPWTLQNDPRLTRIGQLLRKLAADEMPQLINIIKGDMSFVGPRPEDPNLVAHFSQEIPSFTMRHCIRPGLTGPAQVYCDYNSPASEKLGYDMLYVRERSFWLDLKLILLSFWISFRGKWEHRGRKI